RRLAHAPPCDRPRPPPVVRPAAPGPVRRRPGRGQAGTGPARHPHPRRAPRPAPPRPPEATTQAGERGSDALAEASGCAGLAAVAKGAVARTAYYDVDVGRLDP